jgi:hypothetical protein
VENAKLFELRDGIWTLKLSGTYYQRGYAHGKLLAAEIIDFFEFFTLEFVLKSKKRYEELFLQHHNKNVPIT